MPICWLTDLRKIKVFVRASNNYCQLTNGKSKILLPKWLYKIVSNVDKIVMMSILADHWIDQMFPTPILTVRALSLGWISSALKVTKIQAAYHQTSVIQMSKFGVSTPKSTGFLQVQSCRNVHTLKNWCWWNSVQIFFIFF